MSNPLRIPFAEAIAEPRLLKAWWDRELSAPQRVALKTFYGLPLLATQVWEGWSEVDLWAAQQGYASYDELGMITAIHPHPAYVPHEFKEGWGIWGVRSGKSATLAATVVVYEACCGGHEAFFRPGRQAVCFQVCQDLRLARYSLHGIRSILEMMPFVMQPYKGKPRITNVTADRVELWNGMMVSTCPPTVKSVRGYDAPVAVMDEIGVWSQESDSANPDRAVYSQVSSRQAQFEHPKIIGISSPWNKGGLLYDRWLAGTNGCKLHCEAHPIPNPNCLACQKEQRPHSNRLILHGTTASLGNPLVKKAWLVEERQKDPKAFERECLAVFQDSISGFLDSDKVRAAVKTGTREFPPSPLNVYVAAMDPGFKRDAFAIALGHATPNGVQIDVLRQIRRDPSGPPLNPEYIFDTELVPLLKAYRVGSVECDQYHFESLLQLALQRNFSLNYTPFSATTKASLYGNLKSLINQGRLVLPDHPETIDELCRLEMVLGEAGSVRIAAPKGQHDDMATVVALVTHHCAWLLPTEGKPVEPPTPTLHEVCLQQVEKSHQARFIEGGWD